MRLHSHAGAWFTRGKQVFASPLPVVLLLILTHGYIKPQDPPTLPASPADPFTIAVKVGVVVLHATVQDSKGVLVSGLDRDDFEVFEDGARQQIESFSHEDIPVTVGLVIDNSGSMRPKRPEVIAAALAFARSSNPQDQMFVVSFNENVTFGLPEGTLFTDQPAELRVAMSRIFSNGLTALYDAMAAAFEHLKKGNRDKKVLIVISDGGDNASTQKLDQIVALAKQSDAIIYTIGVFDENDPDRNPGALKQLAKATGGVAFLPRSLKHVAPICKQIAYDIRNQYMIAYVSANGKQDGTYRAIQVRAKAPGRKHLAVRTRAGYYAPLGAQPTPPGGENCHDHPE